MVGAGRFAAMLGRGEHGVLFPESPCLCSPTLRWLAYVLLLLLVLLVCLFTLLGLAKQSKWLVVV
jgi:hypothetical protein